MMDNGTREIIIHQLQDSDKKRSWKVIALIIILIIAFSGAFAIRFHNLDRASLWLDEVLQLGCSTEPISKIWDCFPSGAPPLEYYIQWFFMGGEVDEMHVRLHACVLGSAAVAAMGLWGMAMGGWALSLISMALSLALPLLVRFSQEGRPYALMLLSECLFFAAFWNIARSKHPFRPSLWIALSASIVLCLWSSYLSAIACLYSAIFAVIWWLFRKDRRKRISEMWVNKRGLLIPLILIAGALISGLPVYLRAFQDVSGEFYAPFDGWSAARVGMYLDIYALGYEWTQYIPGARWILIALGSAGWLGWALRRRYASAAHFCVFLFIIIFFGTFLLCKKFNHWIEMRYTLAALPPAIMLAAMGIESISRGGAVLIRATRLISRISSNISFAVIATLLSLALAGFMIHHVFTNPVKRADWRGLSQHLKGESTPETIVVVGDSLDVAVLWHYFQRYEILAPFLVHNYDSTVLNDVLSSHKDVWVIVRPEGIPVQFREVLLLLPREYPSFWRLDVRRNLTAIQIAERRPELKQAIIGHAVREATIYPGHEDCPYLGRGWALPEKWDKVIVCGIDGSMGELFLPLSEATQLKLTFRVYPFAPEREPHLHLQLKINSVALDSKAVEKGWNELSWVVDPKVLRKGLNEVLLIPNRAISPSRIIPSSKDYRKLSVWVEKISLFAY